MGGDGTELDAIKRDVYVIEPNIMGTAVTLYDEGFNKILGEKVALLGGREEHRGQWRQCGLHVHVQHAYSLSEYPHPVVLLAGEYADYPTEPRVAARFAAVEAR